MPPRPRLSLCIPTWNRADCLRGALESGFREMAREAPGTVEILVSDNGSTDATPELIARLQAEHPELRAFRNPESLGFDRNYLRCVEEARGEFVWVMGDDDVWLPGSIRRVLQELEDGADACLCLAEACDHDLNPLVVLPWYLEEEPPTIWHLECREDLMAYFDACARNAGAFAFISVSVLNRDRFLADRETLERGLGTEYIHVWGMLAYLRQSTRLHYIPEVLIQNRLSDARADSWATVNLYGRWMKDLRVWSQIADGVLGDDPELNAAFCRILGRNHHDTILPGLRKCAPTEADWLLAVPYLERAGFTPVQIAGVNLAYQLLKGERPPMPGLDAASLCVGDLRILARAARRIAVLAPRGADGDVYHLIRALDPWGGPLQIRCFGGVEPVDASASVSCELWDEERVQTEVSYREACAQGLRQWAPELVLSLDRSRSEAWDEIARASRAAGTLSFEGPPGLDPARNQPYSRLLPLDISIPAMLEALGSPRHAS
jgi:glycosyltransferase involved in cell wall biosynthesis